MRGTYLCLVAVLWLCFFEGGGSANELSSADAALRKLRAELLSGEIVRARILHLSYEIETPAALTSNMLEGYGDYIGMKINMELSRPLIKRLVGAIDRTVLYQSKYQPDLRWGIIFTDRNGQPMHTIYLNSRYLTGTGRIGYIDGTLVGLNGFLVYWFESNFLPLTR